MQLRRINTEKHLDYEKSIDEHHAPGGVTLRGGKSADRVSHSRLRKRDGLFVHT